MTWVSTDSEAFSMLPAFANAITEFGLDSPSLRAIASRGHCSPGTLRNWFDNKSGLHRRVLYVLGVKWGHFLFGGLLPEGEMGLYYARVRLAFEEIGRTDAAVGAVLDDLVKLECEAICRRLDSERNIRHPDPRLVLVVHALLMRLWDVRAYPDRISARLLLAQVVDALFGSAQPEHEDGTTHLRSQRALWSSDWPMAH